MVEPNPAGAVGQRPGRHVTTQNDRPPLQARWACVRTWFVTFPPTGLEGDVVVEADHRRPRRELAACTGRRNTKASSRMTKSESALGGPAAADRALGRCCPSRSPPKPATGSSSEPSQGSESSATQPQMCTSSSRQMRLLRMGCTWIRRCSCTWRGVRACVPRYPGRRASLRRRSPS